ncbi:hypothetical protein HanRHA438_Chr03g0101521 [Helianthus annuus]|nr:hypothetical protein HanRHA438_Chr03g0101521 [Helianthus annuus]
MLARVEVVAVVTDVMSVGRECFRPILCLARWPPLHSVDDTSYECHFFLTGPGCHSGSWDGGDQRGSRFKTVGSRWGFGSWDGGTSGVGVAIYRPLGDPGGGYKRWGDGGTSLNFKIQNFKTTA